MVGLCFVDVCGCSIPCPYCPSVQAPNVRCLISTGRQQTEASRSRAAQSSVTVLSNARALRQAFAGIVTVSVGHCHPRVVAAINAQNARLQHTTTIYLHHQIAEYGRELTARLPGDLKAPKTLNPNVPCTPGPGLFCALALFHDTAWPRPHDKSLMYDSMRCALCSGPRAV